MTESENSSPPRKSRCPDAFSQRNADLYARSREHVHAAIMSLQARGERVSKAAIREETRRLYPGCPPVAESTLQRNADCRAACEAACPKPLRPRRHQPLRAGNRYLARKSKAYLIDELLKTRVRLGHAQRMLKALCEDNATLRTKLGS